MILLLKIGFICTLVIMCMHIIAKIVAGNIKRDIYKGTGRLNFNISIKNKYILRSILSIFVALLSVLYGNGVIKSLFCGFIFFGVICWYVQIQNSSRKKQVLQDLLNVSECLRVQISAGISLDVALRNISTLCKNKEFSQELANLYLEYQLSKYTVSNSAKELQEKFNYSEIKMFISAINQQTQSTSALEAFDNLIEVLKEKYIGYMEDVTKSKSAIMILGVCIVVFNLATMSVYPLVMEANEALKVMLK